MARRLDLPAALLNPRELHGRGAAVAGFDDDEPNDWSVGGTGGRREWGRFVIEVNSQGRLAVVEVNEVNRWLVEGGSGPSSSLDAALGPAHPCGILAQHAVAVAVSRPDEQAGTITDGDAADLAADSVDLSGVTAPDHLRELARHLAGRQPSSSAPWPFAAARLPSSLHLLDIMTVDETWPAANYAWKLIRRVLRPTEWSSDEWLVNDYFDALPPDGDDSHFTGHPPCPRRYCPSRF